jgi:hypothetical protein
MKCIFATHLTLTWGVYATRHILMRTTIWAVRHLRPQLSTFLGLVQTPAAHTPLKANPNSQPKTGAKHVKATANRERQGVATDPPKQRLRFHRETGNETNIDTEEEQEVDLESPTREAAERRTAKQHKSKPPLLKSQSDAPAVALSHGAHDGSSEDEVKANSGSLQVNHHQRSHSAAGVSKIDRPALKRAIDTVDISAALDDLHIPSRFEEEEEDCKPEKIVDKDWKTVEPKAGTPSTQPGTQSRGVPSVFNFQSLWELIGGSPALQIFVNGWRNQKSEADSQTLWYVRRYLYEVLFAALLFLVSFFATSFVVTLCF